MSVENILECKGHITGVHKRDTKFVADIFFDSINDINPEKKLVYLHMFNAANVYRKAKKN